MEDQIIQVKTGQSIDWIGKWSVADQPQNLNGFEILCQIRDGIGNLRLSMDVVIENQDTRRGYYSISASGESTSTVKPGVYDCDVRYRNIDTDQIEYTRTFLVEFLSSVSKAVP